MVFLVFYAKKHHYALLLFATVLPSPYSLNSPLLLLCVCVCVRTYMHNTLYIV